MAATCAICLERWKEPVVGPCGHTFCDACVHALRACPCCRAPVNQWAPNFALRNAPPLDDLPPPLPAPPPACPLARVEHLLETQYGYQRMARRGFAASDLWALLLTVFHTPTLATLTLPEGVAHVRAQHSGKLEVMVPAELAQCWLSFRLKGEQHVFFARERPVWSDSIVRRWQNESRALRRRCPEGKVRLRTRS